MKKEKILFITNLLPYPLDNGGKIKSYNTLMLLRELYDIDLYCFVEKAEERAHAAHFEAMGIRVHCFVRKLRFRLHPYSMFWKILQSLLLFQSYVILKYASFAMRRAVAEALRSSDYRLIYVDHLPLFQYVPAQWLEARQQDVYLDQHNVESEVIENTLNHAKGMLKRLFLQVELGKLLEFEKIACQSAGLVLAITDRDRRKLIELTTGGSRVVESPYFRAHELALKDYAASPREKIILYLGTLSWFPNEDGVLWFHEHVFSAFGLAEQGWKFMIVGNSPMKRVLDLHDGKSTIVTGYVPDVRPYLEEAMIAVIPRWIQGGMLIKAFDYLDAGIPIVATTIGSDGIRVTDGKDVLLADSAGGFYRAITRLEKDPALRERLSREGRHLLETEYSLVRARARFKEILLNGTQ